MVAWKEIHLVSKSPHLKLVDQVTHSHACTMLNALLKGEAFVSISNIFITLVYNKILVTRPRKSNYHEAASEVPLPQHLRWSIIIEGDLDLLQFDLGVFLFLGLILAWGVLMRSTYS